jgi:23S rRNA pseudouridine1911/1915/1917 synthase
MKKQHSLEILFEDQWIVVVSKPSGMLSVGFPGSRGKTAEDILADMNRSRGKVRVSAVHRLDRDTSGVMMFALSVEAKKRIMDDWQDMVSERVYRAVCAHASLDGRGHRDERADQLPDSGTIDAPLAYNRNDVAYVPRKGDFKALKDAEKAVTHFRVIERGARYDLVECSLETGRKNQIRAHMAHLGHPVAGDDVYGDRASIAHGTPPDHASGDGRADDADRLCLHARVLAFAHPYTGEQHRFEVAEPDSFVKLVRAGRGARDAQGLKAGDDGKAIPRRQRGKTPRAAYAKTDDDVKNIEDLKDLKPLPKKSRTRQDTGKSRFIPDRFSPSREK